MRALALGLVLLTPGVAASGTLDTPLVIATIDNGHERDCVEDLTGLCLAERTGDSPSDMNVDARQRFRYVRIALNDTTFEQTPAYELLPDGALVLEPSDLRKEHPVFRELTEHVGRQEAPVVGLVIVFNERGHGFELTPPILDHTASMWIPYSHFGFIEYEHISPPDDPGQSSTDAEVGSSPECRLLDVENECDAALETPRAIWRNATPNIAYSIDMDEVGLAPHADMFEGQATRARVQDELDPLRHRATTSPEGRPRDQTGPTAPPLPREPIHQADAASRPNETPHPRARPTPPRTIPPAPARAPPTAAIVLTTTAIAIAILLAAFYSRIVHNEHALFSTRRQHILALLEQRGPLGLAEMARHLGLDRSTIQHHARLLERTGHVLLHKSRGRMFVSLPGQVVPALPPRTNDATAPIVRELRAAGGILARATLHARLAGELSHRQRNYAMLRLVSSGAAQRVIQDGGDALRLTPTTSTPRQAARGV